MRGLYAITHWGHTVLVFILILTGTLIFFPDARLFLFKGYSLVFSQVHRYSGALYIPVTCTFITIAIKNGSVKNNIPVNILYWKKTHTIILGLTTLVFSLSGVALWFYNHVPVKVIDISALMHQVFTLILLIMLFIHIILIFAKNKVKNGVKK
jgi:cytochrome b subunit of formate dehydrogenase